jgi:hypothetical protein
MPKDIKHETCQELLDFVEKGGYDESLKNFIRSGVEQREAQGTAPGERRPPRRISQNP